MEPQDPGTAQPDERDPGATVPEETAADGQGATEGHESQPTEETFFDPASLPDELKTQWKRMQGTFSRRMNEIKGMKDAADLVQRFNNDPDFAAQVIQQRAAQLGLNLGRQTTAPTSTPPTQQEPPTEFVEAMRQQFPEELQWMVPYQAKAWWAANQKAIEPIMQKLSAHDQTRADELWAEAESAMDEKYPHWRDDEDALAELTTFLRSPQLRHAKYGNKIEILWKALKGEALGVSEATRRMSQAGRNRVSTGSSLRATTDNVTERVKQAKTSNEAFRIAAQAALDEMKGQ